MKIIKYISAFALGLIALLGLVQFVIVLMAIMEQPEAGLAYAFGEVIGTLLFTVFAAAGATFLVSSARGVKQETKDTEPGT